MLWHFSKKITLIVTSFGLRDSETIGDVGSVYKDQILPNGRIQHIMAHRFDSFMLMMSSQMKNADVTHALRAKLHETCCH